LPVVPVVEVALAKKVLLVAVSVIAPTSLQVKSLRVKIPLVKPLRAGAVVPPNVPSAAPALVGATRVRVKLTVSVALLEPKPKLGVASPPEARAVIVALKAFPAVAKALPPPVKPGSTGETVQSPTTEAAQGMTPKSNGFTKNPPAGKVEPVNAVSNVPPAVLLAHSVTLPTSLSTKVSGALPLASKVTLTGKTLE
jgi:hypothetical protein